MAIKLQKEETPEYKTVRETNERIARLEATVKEQERQLAENRVAAARAQGYREGVEAAMRERDRPSMPMMMGLPWHR